MADTGIANLKNTVKEYLFLTKRGMSDFNATFQLAVRGLNDLRMFNLRCVKTVKRVPSNVGIIDFPDDLFEPVWLFIQEGGVLKPIPHHPDMVYTKTLEDGVLTNNSDQGEGEDLPSGNTTYGTGTHGAKGDFYFHQDDTNRRWVINGEPTVVFVKYVANAVDSSSDSVEYPAKATPALLAYIRYKEAFFNDKINKNAIGLYKREYDVEFDKLKFLNFSMEKFRQLIYRTSSQNPQR